MTRSIEDVPFEPCRALPLAFQVIDQIVKESPSPQLERFLVDDLTHFIHISEHELPDVIKSMGVNLGFVCDGTYPAEKLDRDPVTLQLDANEEGRFSLAVFLNGWVSRSCLPPTYPRGRASQTAHACSRDGRLCHLRQLLAVADRVV